jgi:hypothetical protein
VDFLKVSPDSVGYYVPAFQHGAYPPANGGLIDVPFGSLCYIKGGSVESSLCIKEAPKAISLRSIAFSVLVTTL